MFSLHAEALDPIQLKNAFVDPSSGAFVAFEGWVRDKNEGKQVLRLDYEAYASVAIAEGARIVEDARKRFDVQYAACAHRIGALAIGDMAVWVGVTSVHRAEAFEACRYIIDAIKHTVPIWKKEYYTNGDSGWVNCERCAHPHGHTHILVKPEEYYARQIRLPEVGIAGQKRLCDARVLVVGAGGLGCGALPSLATAGVGVVGICDGDRIELSNLHRQPLYTVADLGLPKASIAANRLRALNPLIACHAYEELLGDENAAEIVADYDLILDCTDNFEAKYLINDLAVRFDKALVQSSIYQYEGQLFVYDPNAKGACMRCLWPEQPKLGCVGTCADVGVLGAVPAVFGALQAAEALKLLLRLPERLTGEMLFLDLLTFRSRRVPIDKFEACTACGTGSRQEAPIALKSVEISLSSLRQDVLANFILVDIRERDEANLAPLGDIPHLVWPASLVQAGAIPFPIGHRYLLCCTQGRRSRQLALLLRKEGYDQVYSLDGGLRSMTAHKS
jgi:molybdopterin/thiamine biosynthesis adenylyltransferase/molybdopterin synthase catalytic subunit/rhodanese-related sulfurtransferase